MTNTAQLLVAKDLMALAETILADADVVEAAKKEPKPHDPLVNELGDLLGSKVAVAVSGLLDKNFPGVPLAGMRQAIRMDTVNAFKKSMKRNFNSYYDRMRAPEITKLETKVEKSKEEKTEEKMASEPKENGQPKPTV